LHPKEVFVKNKFILLETEAWLVSPKIVEVERLRHRLIFK